MIVDSSVSLSDVLRRAKVLASQLRDEGFKTWVDNELKGYPQEYDLPDYRLIQTAVLGTFSGPFGSMVKNTMIPTYNLPEGIQKIAKEVHLGHSVRELEEMAKQEELRHTWPAEMVMAIRDDIKMSGGYVLVEVHQPISSGTVQGVLDAVRNRLLDFILELQGFKPDLLAEGSSLDDLPPDKVSQIFNVTIYGDHSILAGGRSVTQQVFQSVQQNQKDDLINYLRELGIEDADLKELLEAVEHDGQPEKDRFGPRVSDWLGKMVSKAASGVWKTALATAPTLISKALASYYGWDQ